MNKDYERDEVGIYRRKIEDGRYIFLDTSNSHHIILALSEKPPLELSGMYHDVWIYYKFEKATHAFEMWNPVTQPEPVEWNRHPSTGRRESVGVRSVAAMEDLLHINDGFLFLSPQRDVSYSINTNTSGGVFFQRDAQMRGTKQIHDLVAREYSSLTEL